MREMNFLLTKDSHVNEFVELWKPYVDIIRIGPILPISIWNGSNFDLKVNEDLEEKLLPCNNFVEGMFCAQPFQSIVIRANGELALCCSDYDSTLNFGTYKDLAKVYKTNENFNKIRDEFKTNTLNICKNCFQNFEIRKDTLLEYLPELEKYFDDDKCRIYYNR